MDLTVERWWVVKLNWDATTALLGVDARLCDSSGHSSVSSDASGRQLVMWSLGIKSGEKGLIMEINVIENREQEKKVFRAPWPHRTMFFWFLVTARLSSWCMERIEAGSLGGVKWLACLAAWIGSRRLTASLQGRQIKYTCRRHMGREECPSLLFIHGPELYPRNSFLSGYLWGRNLLRGEELISSCYKVFKVVIISFL